MIVNRKPSPATRVWRDPEDLEAYLDDELEQSVYAFSMSSLSLSHMLVGTLSMPDDPLLNLDSDPKTGASATTLALERLSPSAADLYTKASQEYTDVSHNPVSVITLAHVLRELDATIRSVWWDLTCSTDQEAKRVRQQALDADPGARDAPHHVQIGLLASRLGLSQYDTETWLQATSLHRLAHRGRIGPTRRLSHEEDERLAEFLRLIPRIVSGTESAYGDALVRAAALIDAGSSKAATTVLTQHFPYHPPLRHWLLAQVDTPSWLRPLHRAEMLAPAEPMTRDALGSPVAPVAHGARATARVAPMLRDDDLVRGLATEWLSINNPRLHTDVIQILLELPSGLYQEFIPRLCSWLTESPYHAEIVRLVGDRGVLRFPSHCLALALRALGEGQVVHADRLAVVTAEAIADSSRDGDDFTKQANLALLGVRSRLSTRTQGFLVSRFVQVARRFTV
jgi:hypothetical protein